MKPAMRRARRGMLGGAAALALLAAGCERESNAPPPVPPVAAELAAEPAPDAVTEQPAPDAVRAPAAPGAVEPDSAFSGESEPPALPQDVPLYTSALPISSMSSPTRGTIVNLHSQDAVDVVAKWYGNELAARGWLLETQSGATNSHLVTAVKQGRKATVLITGGPDGTKILVTVLESH